MTSRKAVAINPEARAFNGQDGVKLREHVEAQCAAYRAHYDSRLLALQEQVGARFVAIEKAADAARGTMEKGTEAARQSIDKRLDSMNEFRDALKDQASRMATRDELNMRLDQVMSRVEGVEKYQHTAEGKASQTAFLITLAIALVSLALTIAKFAQ